MSLGWQTQNLELLNENKIFSLVTFWELFFLMDQDAPQKENGSDIGKYVFQTPKMRPK